MFHVFGKVPSVESISNKRAIVETDKSLGLKSVNRDVYFWQNMPSPHQAPLIRAFSEVWPGKVSVILDEHLDERRRKSGWTKPDYGGVQVFEAPDPIERLEIERLIKAHDINIFSGLEAYAGVTASMKRLAQRNSTTTVLYMEPWRMNGLSGILRSLKYRLLCRRWRRSVSLVLATGATAIEQLRRVGFPTTTVAAFAYFVKGPSDRVAENVNSTPELIFVGNLVALKRVDLLLRALSNARRRKWHLHIVGTGPLELSLQQLASHLKISERITWHGSMENVRAQHMISNADALILPSAYDGWGAVIGEALLRGTPVVVSDAVGSYEVVTEPAMGIAVKANSLEELQIALERMILKGPQRFDDRVALAAECDRRMSAAAGADYLAMLLTSVDDPESRPRAPWRDARAMSTTTDEVQSGSDAPRPAAAPSQDRPISDDLWKGRK